jgi:hypothetical protein
MSFVSWFGFFVYGLVDGWLRMGFSMIYIRSGRYRDKQLPIVIRSDPRWLCTRLTARLPDPIDRRQVKMCWQWFNRF